MILLGVSIKTCEQSRMTRHLLFAVLMNASGKLSNIASRGNQTIKFFNNLLNNFLQVVKLNEGFVGDISKYSTMSSFNSPNHNRFIVKRNSSWGFNDVGSFFLPVLFKICMVCFGPFQYEICGVYGLINVKIILKKSTDGIPVSNLIFVSVLIFFHINLLCHWTKTLIGRVEALILSFKILFIILSALISSAKWEGHVFFIPTV